ncbi:MAG TPA: PH domain-containing protein [Euzebyales bacterium]|nr:PH domain-containing protein [Euzebyales bacterium]
MSEAGSNAPTEAPATPATHPDATLLEGRLHSSVIVLWTLQMFAPLAALWIASSAEQLVALAGVAIALFASWVRWTRFRWRIESDQLIIERGLLERTRRVIPIERIQAVQTVRKIRHRVFGVVGLRIETVGGSETEGQLDALTPPVATAVQRVLLRQVDAAPAPTEAPSGTVLAQCPPRMLFIAGLTGGRVGVAAALLAGAQEFAGERLVNAVVSAPERFGVTVLVLLVLLGMAAAFLLSVVATAVTYWNFTVTRDGDLIRLQRGLLDERRDTVPLTRVQALVIEENFVRRPLGLAAVKMIVAGRAGEDEALSSTLLPIASREEAFAIAGIVLGHDGLERVSLLPMPPAARLRRVWRAVAVVAVIVAAGLVVLDVPLGLVGLLSAGAAFPAAFGAYRALGWRRDAEVVLARDGVFVRRTSVTPVHAPQSLSVTSSPFQRRRGLATLRIELARTGRARDPRVIDVGVRDAEQLQRTLADLVVVRLHDNPAGT